jgi:protein required for attachment to host cells
MITWVIVIDASRARIYSTTGRHQPLHLEREVANPQGRTREQELVSDQAGRIRKGGMHGVHSAMDPQTTAHQAAADQFARELAHTLRHEQERGSFASLVIAAPPHFLGELRPLLGKEVESCLKASVAKDLIHFEGNELRERLNASLELAEQV